jgi:hypothetical protein
MREASSQSDAIIQVNKMITIDVSDGESVELRVRHYISRLCTPYGAIKSLDVFINPPPNNAAGICLVQMTREAELAAAIAALDGIRLVGCAAILFRIEWSA